MGKDRGTCRRVVSLECFQDHHILSFLQVC